MNFDRVAILVKKAALEADKVQAPILQSYDLTVAQYKFLKKLYPELFMTPLPALKSAQIDASLVSTV